MLDADLVVAAADRKACRLFEGACAQGIEPLEEGAIFDEEHGHSTFRLVTTDMRGGGALRPSDALMAKRTGSRAGGPAAVGEPSREALAPPSLVRAISRAGTRTCRLRSSGW